MVDQIRFADPLPQLILEGEKDTTWRIWDDRDVEVNQMVSLKDTDGEKFAEARVLWVKDTTFGRLNEEDRKGHESFNSEKEMFETYEKYYNQEAGPKTEVKVIKFEVKN